MLFCGRLHFMAKMARKFIKPALISGVLSSLTIGAAMAQAGVPVETTQRLSDWLLKQEQQQPQDPWAFTPALQWLVPEEKLAQNKLKQELLKELLIAKDLPVNARQQLSALLTALPVTGRVNVPVADARWLQAHPQNDPVLQGHHSVWLPKRSSSITLFTQEGMQCTLPHQSGAQALDYLTACIGASSNNASNVWVVQPDGRVQEWAVGSWNAQQQHELAPGALMWVVNNPSEAIIQLSRKLAQFLATQSYETVVNAPGMVRLTAGTVVPGVPLRSLPLTANDWGVVGLLQTPTARMSEPGEIRFSAGRVYPYERFNVLVQPFDALEAGFRYTNVANRLYGPAELSGTQAYKDKSIDFKLKLWNESARLPQVALGMIDFGGTGLFASEYVVANKRFGNLDASLGMGWGYLGASGNVTNPLTKLSSKFETRNTNFGMGGTPAFKSFFRGPAALFGGVQYHTPWHNWVLKAEYDGNNYRNEPQANNRKQSSPINLGVVYRPSPYVDISFGIERGNTAMVGLTLHTSVAKLNAPKVSDAPSPSVVAARPQQASDLTGTAADLVAMSAWGIKNMLRVGNVLRVQVEGASGAHWNERIERMVGVLHRDAPADIDSFELVVNEQGVVLTERVINRDAWVKQNTELLPPSAKVLTMVARAPIELQPSSLKVTQPAAQTIWEQTPSKFGYGIVPSWQQNIGGPDGFLLFRAGVSIPMQLKLASNVSITGAVSLNAIDNYDKFKYTAPSNMPRVRTYLREYMTASRINVPSLQITHFGQLANNQYYSVYGGYLESMYGGVGAEWLYRAWHSPVAFGVDVNKVQQRSFDQHFGFSKADEQTGYRVTTGHATAYWDTGWFATQVKASVGRYLAGDVGATLDLSKTFSNGVSMGVWATKTNVSAEKFGEGSFDKGLYLRIPFDVMTTTRTSNTANMVYNPLTRDGGARLSRDFTLYGATTARSARDTSFVPAGVGN
jgi:hypothetical protein